MTYSCKNRPPFAPTYRAQDGWENSWARRMVDVEFRGTQGCVYSTSQLGEEDKQCIGCRWRANGQADTGAGAPSVPEQVGDSVDGVREVEGGLAGESGAGGVQQPTPVAETGGGQEQARAASELEAIHPNAAIYRRAE